MGGGGGTYVTEGAFGVEGGGAASDACSVGCGSAGGFASVVGHCGMSDYVVVGCGVVGRGGRGSW